MKSSNVIKALHAWKVMASELQSDIDRFSSNHWFLIFLGTKGIWVCTQYRVSRWIHYYAHAPIIRQILKILCFFWQKLIESITGAEVPNRAKIGKGLLINHTNGVVIHVDAIIGEYCNIGHQVTIGIGGRGEKCGVPKIGNRVFIGPGAKIFGAISIGNDVAIGANSVVTKDIPDNAIAVGIPAKVISYRGSREIINLREKIEHQEHEF
ncbi:serine O-acetyltransferase [Leptolyngbya sp. Heron Island J]|uniref:serine O-acetyltransferase n=1 Tax=Leptolyngbya sp. Heron Island J TaxID=1385935 RepID=UPI00190F9AAF|nr:serine O-acetyltransferase [Leptolyngbya sp. Heron Island J]